MEGVHNNFNKEMMLMKQCIQLDKYHMKIRFIKYCDMISWHVHTHQLQMSTCDMISYGMYILINCKCPLIESAKYFMPL
jgi:hypothetical protein